MPAINSSTKFYANTPQAVTKNIYDYFSIVNINFCNTGTTTAQISLAVSNSQSSPAASEYIDYQITLPSYGVYERQALCYNPGQYIVAVSSSASVVCQVYGHGLSNIALTNDIVTQLPPGSLTGRAVSININGSLQALKPAVSVGSITSFTNSSGSVPSATGTNWGPLVSSGTVAMAISSQYSSTGWVLTTTDGNTWTQQATLPSTAINVTWSLAYGAGTWVAVAGGSNAPSNQVAYSTNNGTSWTGITPLSSSYWRTTVYGNGVFVAWLGTTGYRSADGITWNTVSASTASSTLLFYVSGSFNSWFLFAYGGANSISVESSTNNLTSWNTRNLYTLTGLGSSIAVAYGNGVFVVVNQDNTQLAWTSTNAVTWTQRSSIFGGANVYAGTLQFVGGYFVVTCGAFSTFINGVFYSSDGVTWTSVSFGSNVPSLIVALNS
jgi:hypothetical protein